jgi:DNA primase
MMDRTELNRALDKIDLETYFDREGIDYRTSYGTKGLQLNLTDCPKCGEGGRKTYINADSGLGNCFHGACSEKFNKFKLIRAVSGLSGAEFDTYVQAVASEQGWMPKKERPALVEGVLKMPSKLVPLPVNGQNLQYLQDRGVSLDSCKWFNLSYCHGGWWTYTLSDGTERFVKYDKRVIVPIADLEGKVVSFQGRDVTGEQEPKYLFPVGFAVAGSHLYNGHNFAEGVTTHAVIGEGAFDAIAVHQALEGEKGCEGMLALATFGMHLSGGPGGQIEKFGLLRDKGLTTVTFMWDGEGKALAYAVKAGLQLRGIGLTVRIARLPAGYDPAQAPDKTITPPALVRTALFEATVLTNLTAIRLAHAASLMS